MILHYCCCNAILNIALLHWFFQINFLYFPDIEGKTNAVVCITWSSAHLSSMRSAWFAFSWQAILTFSSAMFISSAVITVPFTSNTLPGALVGITSWWLSTSSTPDGVGGRASVVAMVASVVAVVTSGVAMVTSDEDNCDWSATPADVIPSQISSATVDSSSHLQ